MYGAWIEGIDEGDNWENDITQAVITRSMVEDVWSQLTPDEQKAVHAADHLLVDHWEQVAELLLDPRGHPRTHWWWYLHEGPHVREEARKVSLRGYR
jgi:hypothetical protein